MDRRPPTLWVYIGMGVGGGGGYAGTGRCVMWEVIGMEWQVEMCLCGSCSGWGRRECITTEH